MSPGGRPWPVRPLPVRRHLRRPLWLAAAAAVLVLVTSTLDAASARRAGDRLDRGIAVTGTVERRGPGSNLSVSYANPLTDQVVTVPVEVWDAARPEVGATVALDVARADPEEVVLAGDRKPATADLWWYLPLAGIPLVVWVTRVRAQRRREALAASDATSFAMLGSIAGPRSLGRRCELSLYALDSAPGADPVATVALLSTEGLPIGDVVFGVEVKGSPRPHGRLVPRVGDRVVWPVGGALSVASRPRPAPLCEPPEPEPVPAGHASAGDTFPSPSRQALATQAALFAAAVVLGVGVAVVTFSGRADARRLTATGATVTAEVVARGGTSVTVSYPDPDGTAVGAQVEQVVSVAFPDEYTVGRRYPARVLDGRVRFDREPYDASTPIGWAAIPAAVFGTALGRRRWGWRKVGQASRSGPFVAVEAVLAGNGRVALRPPGLAADLCQVAVVPPPGASPGPAVAAGSLEPGGWVALWQGGRWLAVSARALPPVRPRKRTAARPWSRLWWARRPLPGGES